VKEIEKDPNRILQNFKATLIAISIAVYAIKRERLFVSLKLNFFIKKVPPDNIGEYRENY